MYESPKIYYHNKSRYSIRTNLVSYRNPYKIARYLKIFIFSFIVFLVLYILNQAKPKLTNYQLEKNTNPLMIQENNQIDFKIIDFQLEKLNDPRIVVAFQQNSQNHKKKMLKQFIEEKYKNKIISQIRFESNEHVNYFQKLTLCAVKHQKLTSIKRPQRGWIYSVFNLLIKENPYQGIERIFSPGNSNLWNSNGRILTVVSNHTFRPQSFALNISLSNSKKVHIFGLRIEQTSIATSKKITKSLLGTYSLKTGQNILICLNLQCYQQYSMIIFVMNPISIATIQIYSRNKYQKDI